LTEEPSKYTCVNVRNGAFDDVDVPAAFVYCTYEYMYTLLGMLPLREKREGMFSYILVSCWLQVRLDQVEWFLREFEAQSLSGIRWLCAQSVACMYGQVNPIACL